MSDGKLLLNMLNTDDVTMSIREGDSIKESGVTSVAVSPVNIRCVAAVSICMRLIFFQGSLDRMVRIWDTNTGAVLERFVGHQDSVYSVAFSPDGRSIVSGALDQTLKIWDLNPATIEFLSRAPSSHPIKKPTTIVTTQCRHTFAGHRDYVLSVEFLGRNGSFGRVDGRGQPVLGPGGDALSEIEWVVSGSKDWSVVFWDARGGNEPVKVDAAQFMLQGHANSGKHTM
jgi:glucose repression regulatory protein TUP1